MCTFGVMVRGDVAVRRKDQGCKGPAKPNHNRSVLLGHAMPESRHIRLTLTPIPTDTPHAANRPLPQGLRPPLLPPPKKHKSAPYRVEACRVAHQPCGVQHPLLVNRHGKVTLGGRGGAGGGTT
jgi:hypothetical protein